jgi:hypothetical protein
MKTNKKWKHRKSVLDFLKPYLLKILSSESAPNIEDSIEKITGLNSSELQLIKKIHFLLSSEVRELIAILPYLMRNLSHSTEKETVECRGMVKGRIDWGLTIKERYSRGFNDPTLFICKPASKMYDLPENQLLKFILNKIQDFSENIDFINIPEEDVFEESQMKYYSSIIFDKYFASKKTLKHVQFQYIKDVKFIKAKNLQRTRNHRNKHYRTVVNCYNLYQDLFILNDQKTLRKLVEKQLLEPLNNDKLYELYVLFKIIEKLESLDGSVSIGLVKPGKKANNYIAQYKSAEKTINVYYQKMPGGCWKNSEYKEIFDSYNLGVSLRRPDIILEFEEDHSYRLVEVKRSSRKEYISDSVYKVIGYINDFKKCYPDKNPLDGVLVVWGGIKIEKWNRAIQNQILILSNSDLDKGLKHVLNLN